MATANFHGNQVLDIIKSIRKVGSDSAENAEIFFRFQETGFYSIDRVFPEFDTFWVNAQVGSKVLVSVTPSGWITSIKFVGQNQS